MSVQFNEPQSTVSVRPAQRSSKLAQFVIKTGIVKTETGAQIVLLVVGIVLIVLSAFLFMKGNVKLLEPTPEQTAL